MESQILPVVIEQVKKISFAKDVAPDTALVESGLIDSIGLVDLLNSLEDSFKIQVDLASVTPETFASPRTIATFLEGYMSK